MGTVLLTTCKLYRVLPLLPELGYCNKYTSTYCHYLIHFHFADESPVERIGVAQQAQTFLFQQEIRGAGGSKR